MNTWRLVLSLLILLNGQSSLASSDAVAHYNNQHPGASQLSEGFVTTDAGRLHYVSAGSGPLVVLHHGFPSFWYAWKNQIRELSKTHQVVAFDGLGVNLSDKPSELSEYTVKALTHTLNQAVSKLSDAPRFILIGHDWGGTLAWSFAQRYPDRLTKLIVLNAPPYNLFLELLANNPQQQKTSRYMTLLQHPAIEYSLSLNRAYLLWRSAYRKLITPGHFSEAEGELFRNALGSKGTVTGAINWYRANIPASSSDMGSFVWPAVDATTNVESLLIWGKLDRTFAPEFLNQIPRFAKRHRTEIIADAAHWPAVTHPDQVNQIISEFLCTNSSCDTIQPAKSLSSN